MKKTVLITGACINTGVAIVEKFAKNGWNVVFTGRNCETVHAKEKEYKENLEQYENEFIAEMGAEAIQRLLDEYDPDCYVHYFTQYLSMVSEIIGMPETQVHDFLHKRIYYVEEAGQSGYQSDTIVSYADYKEMLLPYNRRCEDDTNTPARVKTGFAYILELFDQHFDPTDERYAVLRKENWINDLQWVSNELKEELKDLPEYRAWISGDNERNVPPGGESGEQMRKRVLEAFSEIREDTVLVAHGGVIAAIMEYLFPEEHKSRYEWQPQNGCGYAVMNGCHWSSLSECVTKL